MSINLNHTSDTVRPDSGNLAITGNVVSDGGIFGNFLTDQVRQTQITLSSSATTTLDLNSSSNFYINLVGNSNIAFGNVNISTGSSGYLMFKQDVSGGRYFTLPATCKTPGGRTIVQETASGALSLITYYVVDSSTIIVNYIGDFK
jgi:hypothetical protein